MFCQHKITVFCLPRWMCVLFYVPVTGWFMEFSVQSLFHHHVRCACFSWINICVAAAWFCKLMENWSDRGSHNTDPRSTWTHLIPFLFSSVGVGHSHRWCSSRWPWVSHKPSWIRGSGAWLRTRYIPLRARHLWNVIKHTLEPRLWAPKYPNSNNIFSF